MKSWRADGLGGMARRRSVLASMLVICAVLALAAGASTFSAFSDSASGTSNQLTAGTVDVVVNDDTDDNFEISFGLSCVAAALAPGEVCTQEIAVRNAGSLGFTYAVDAWSDTNGLDDGDGGPAGDTLVSCYKVHLQQPAGSAPNYATVLAGNSSISAMAPAAYPANGHLGATQSQTWRLSVVIDSDGACSGAEAYILMRVVAVQSANPHAP